MAYILVGSVILLSVLIWVILKSGILNPARKGLRILMYNKDSAVETGKLATGSTIGRLRILMN
jgi:hypothetical protein